MTTYVMRNNRLVPKAVASPLNYSSSATNVISDTMDATRHMATNKYYTSKSQFRAATKAAGCIELGEEVPYLLKPRKPVPLDRAKRRDDIRRTLYEMRNK